MRKPVIFLLFFTVLTPIVLYTDKLGTPNRSSSKTEFIEEDISSLSFGGEIRPLHLLPRESENTIKEPVRLIYTENSSDSIQKSGEVTASTTEELPSGESIEHKARALSTTDDENESEKENPIKEVTDDGVSTENENDVDSFKTLESIEQIGNVEETKEVETEEKPILSDLTSSDVTDNLFEVLGF